MKQIFAALFSLLIHLALLVLVLALAQKQKSSEGDFLLRPLRGEIFLVNSVKQEKMRMHDSFSQKAVNQKSNASSSASIGTANSAAIAIGEIHPDYPPLSRHAGEEGEVEVLLNISAQGMPVQAEILKSSGYKRLDDAAKKTLLAARFQPSSERDLSAQKRITLVYQLKNKNASLE